MISDALRTELHAIGYQAVDLWFTNDVSSSPHWLHFTSFYLLSYDQSIIYFRV